MFYFSMNTAADLTLWERIAAWYEASVFHELAEYISDTYYTVEFGAYEHFQLGADAGSFAQGVILALAIALVAASAVAAYTRTWVGAFVRELVKREVHSPEQAQTLLELGFFRSVAVRRELKHGLQLRKLVLCREKEEFLASRQPASSEEKGQGSDEFSSRSDVREIAQTDKADFSENTPNDTAKQGDVPSNETQISVRQIAQADGFVLDFKSAHFYVPSDLRYLASTRYEKKGSGWIQVLLTAVVAVILSAVICRFLPDLVQLADNIISLMSPQ